MSADRHEASRIHLWRLEYVFKESGLAEYMEMIAKSLYWKCLQDLTVEEVDKLEEFARQWGSLPRPPAYDLCAEV